MTARPDRDLLAGVALVCFANLLLEVTLTRIFSATMYYHFTFLAIALALFGMGASGVYVYVQKDRFPPERAREQLAQNARRFALATILCVVYVLANPIEIVIVTGSNQVPTFSSRTFLQLLLLNGISALPFFYAGMVVSLAVAHYRRHIDRIYFFDLGGAAGAALLCGPLVGVLGAPTLVLAIAALALVAAALFRRPGAGGWIALAACAALAAGNLAVQLIAVPTVKGVRAEQIIFEKWNIFSRVTVDKTLEIKIDASAATHINNLADAGKVDLHKEITATAYGIFAGAAPPDHVLIIGPGGGRDVVHALAAGARRVTGVEVNPIIAEDIMKGRFRKDSGELYLDPRVEVVTGEGRSYVRRSRERYDLIQASLVDTWAATAAGAFALTENTLYTLEAFGDYYDHLTDRGVVTMTRWDTGENGESARLLLLAAAALERRGVPPAETRGHIFYAVHDGFGTLIAKRSPLAADEIARLNAWCAAAKHRVVLSPETPGGSRLESLLAAGAFSREVARQGEDLRPPTDDRPFFFYFVKTRNLFSFKHFLGRVSLNNPALWILVSFAAVGGLTCLFIVVPLLRRAADLRGGGGRAQRRRLFALLYFCLLGLGFITVEIALLQKLTFFLGHPSSSLIVVLFSILIGTAAGARMTGRVSPERRAATVTAAALAVAGLAAAIAFIVAPLLSAWVAWPWAARAALAAALVGGCGVVMGFLLPLGMATIPEEDAAIVPWAWGLNGAMSVLGTVAATVVAIQTGFTVTLLAGGAIYLAVPLVYRGCRTNQ